MIQSLLIKKIAEYKSATHPRRRNYKLINGKFIRMSAVKANENTQPRYIICGKTYNSLNAVRIDHKLCHETIRKRMNDITNDEWIKLPRIN